MKRVAISTVFSFALCASVSSHAGGSTEPPESLFSGIIQERDVTLAFDYLRNAFKAAMEGREVRPPEELTQRAEAVGEELKRRGASAAQAAIDALEESVRNGMRDPNRLPPTSSQQRI